MLITPHALAGATIVVLIPNPVIAIPIAVGSHFILDSIPHWQEIFYPYKATPTTWIRIPIDLALAVILVSIISIHHPDITNLIWISAFAANAPDLDSVASIWPISLRNKVFKTYYNWHCVIQRETASFKGILTQLVLVVGSLIITLK